MQLQFWVLLIVCRFLTVNDVIRVWIFYAGVSIM